MTRLLAILALLLLAGFATAPKPTMQRIAAPARYGGEIAPSLPTITTTFYGSSNDAVLGFVELWHTVHVEGTNRATVVFEDSPSLTPAVWSPVCTMQFVSGQVNQVTQPFVDAPQGFERVRLVTP